MGSYRTSEVCPNGHVSTESADEHPELREKFCSRCGEPTITQCPACKSNIRGQFHIPGVARLRTDYEHPPAFCFNCGAVFPWTERKLKAATDLVAVGNVLTETELEELRRDLNELEKDTPRVQVAALGFKTFMAKAGPAIASGVKDIVVDVLSEAAKKAIWGQ